MSLDLKELRDNCLGESLHRNYSLAKVEMLSPYLSDTFFNELKKLKPKKVFILSDAGCSDDLIDSIKQSLGRQLGDIKLAQCAGIVHAKCYLFHWQNKDTKRYKRLLLWGSCNATDGGFNKNAEIFSWLLLSKMGSSQRREVISYFSELFSEDVLVVDGHEIVNDGLTIKFPEIKIYNKEEITFDLWLQKGRLCHPFPYDPNFRHLKIQLKSKISPEDELSVALSKNGIGINQKTVIAYDYLRQNDSNNIEVEDVDEDDDCTKNWKSKYFIDTVYGYWTSEDCFKEKGATFYRQDAPTKTTEIETISNAKDTEKEKWIEEFVAKLQAICSSLKHPDNFFDYKNDKLDVDKYRDQFKSQLNRDVLRAKDPWFQHGYISGFAFPEIPPLREFKSNWDEFLKSFSDSLFFEVNKPHTRSKLAQAIRAIDIHRDSEFFLENLRNNWQEHKENIEDILTI